MGGYSRIGVFILILAGIVAYLKTGSTLFEKVKISGTRLQMSSIDRALQAYELQKRRYPTNFVAFMRKSFDSKEGKDSALDAWGHQYNYSARSKGFTIASAGADGKFGTEDDISWVREGENAGLEQGRSQFKGIASATVKSSKKTTTGETDDPLLKDFQALFSSSSLGNGIEKEMTDKELLEFLEGYMEQVIFE